MANARQELEPLSPIATSAPAGGGAQVRFASRLFYSSPELIASGAAGFCIPGMISLLAGRFYVPWVLGLGLVGAALAIVVCGFEAPPDHDRRWRLWTLLAAVAVIGWFFLNAHWSSQDLYATRDPAVYNLTGRWLVDHHAMPIATQPDVFGNPGYTSPSGSGFASAGYGFVYAQGNHLLPVLLAVAGWLAGPAVLLKTNVLIGAAALYTFFGMARRIVGGFFALVAMLALAVSMPMLYVARDTYSEPLTLLFLAGGLSLTQRALHTERIRDFGLAGIVVGSAAMARIDSYAAMLSIIVVASAVMAAAPTEQRRRASARAGALLLGAAVPTYLGYRDVRRLSTWYYNYQDGQITPLRDAALVLAALGAFAILAAWYTPVVGWVVDRERRRRRIAPAAAFVTVAGFAFYASRPLWLVNHGTSDWLVVALQKTEGYPVDGTRTYAEQALSWQAWYLGWPTVVLAVAGYALLMYRLVRRGELPLLPLLAMCLSMTALYLWKPAITPDQVWASRRYVPVVIPGLVLAATYALRMAFAEQRWQARRRARPLALVGAAAVILIPAVITWPMERIRDHTGQLALVQSICGAVGRHGAVVEVDQNSSINYEQTIRAYCDVPSVTVVSATSSQLASMRAAAAAHGRTLYAFSQNVAGLFSGATPPPFNSLVARKWSLTVEKVPQSAAPYRLTFWLGRVNPDGTVQSLANPSREGSSR